MCMKCIFLYFLPLHFYLNDMDLQIIFYCLVIFQYLFRNGFKMKLFSVHKNIICMCIIEIKKLTTATTNASMLTINVCENNIILKCNKISQYCSTIYFVHVKCFSNWYTQIIIYYFIFISIVNLYQKLSI